MTGLVIRRLVQLPVILLAIYTATLSLAWLVPGSPVDKPEGRRPSAAVIESLERRYHLDRFDRFYGSYLWRASGARWAAERAGLVERADGGEPSPVFDLGPSLQYPDRTVNEIVGDALPVSVTLGAAALVIALVIGVTAGVVGAWKPGSWWDAATLGVALVGISLPAFVTGAVLILAFGVWLGWFPVGGWGTLGQMVLPAVTLSLPFAAYIARLTRMGMIEQMTSDHVRTARAKGLPERTVLLKHAMKNAMVPVISYMGPAAAHAMTGSFVVERVFRVPGLGEHFVSAVLGKDLFLIMGVVLVYSTMLVLFNLASDVFCRWVDPRFA
ncbi:MAG: ABC transporter permease [Phycisphaeraceae bacterium]|nr:MAG: ABC transporter permease [Phycisphaeraceae bacterium]